MHYMSVFSFLAHMCRREHLAEDLTQDTFAAAWASIGRFNGASSLSTWLLRIARNKFIDHCRRRQELDQISTDELDNNGSNGQDPLRSLLVDEQTQRLSEAIAMLAPKSREVITLHYIQALSYRDVAQVLGEPTGTVKWRTGEAMKQLKTLMGAAKDDDA